MWLLIGCSEHDKVVYVSEQNQRAYIASRFSPNYEITYQGTLDLSNLYLADGKLELGANVMADNGHLDQNFDIFLRTTYKAETAVSGILTVAPDAEELVSSYNSSHNSQYQLLDAGYYAITPDRATVEVGKKECETPFNIVLNGDNELLEGDYLLPLSCTLDSGSNVTMSEGANLVYLKIKISRTRTTYADVVMVQKGEFTASTGNSSSGSNAVDEDSETAWTNETDDEYIDVDFGGGIYLSRVCFVGVDSPMYVYLQTVEEEDFPLSESSTSNNNSDIYVYNPRDNRAAPMDPYVRVKKVRLQFTGGTGHSLKDVYFLKVDESTIHSQVSFDINGETTHTARYSVTAGFHFESNALKYGIIRNGETELDIRATIDYSVNSPLTASCSVSADAQAMVQAYNTAHSTAYELLPETYYTITGKNLDIAAGERQSSSPVHVHLDSEKLDAITYTQAWLLPIACTLDAGGADVTVSEDAKTIYVLVDITGGTTVDMEQKIPSENWLDEGTAYHSSMSIDKAFDSNYRTAFLSGQNEYTIIGSSFDEPIDLKEVVLVNIKLYSSSYSYYAAGYVSFQFQYADESWSNWTSWYQPNTAQDYARLDVSEDVGGKKVSAVYTQINWEGSSYWYGCADIYYYATK